MHEICLAGIGMFALGCQLTVPPEKAPQLEDAQIDVATPDARVPACMTDPTYTGDGAHRYKFTASPTVDYDTAIDRCAADGAHLVVVDSMTEDDYVKSLINGDTWIGFDDLTVEGDFRWVTGATGTFRLWNTGEPDNKEEEDCVAIRGTDGKWDEISCAATRRVLCECDPAYHPPPTPRCRQLGLGTVTRDGRRYFPRLAPATWQDAENDCQSIGAHLAVIGDLHENAQLDMVFNGSAYWIGYTDAVTEGQFQWVNGSPAPFQHFIAGVPSNDAEDCAALLDGGAWDDQPCDTALPYACECDPLPP